MRYIIRFYNKIAYKTVVDGIKAKVSVGDVKDKVGGLLGKLKN